MKKEVKQTSMLCDNPIQLPDKDYLIPCARCQSCENTKLLAQKMLITRAKNNARNKKYLTKKKEKNDEPI